MERVHGFNAFFTPRSRVLILGSFPSVKSRQNEFYYGNPQNAFWRILSSYFGEPLPVTVEAQKDLLIRRDVALWDVVTECEIVGSSDATIKNYTVADIPSLLPQTRVGAILINGGTAYNVFVKNFARLPLPCCKLPSTSPANTKPKKEAWFDALRTAFERTT